MAEHVFNRDFWCDFLNCCHHLSHQWSAFSVQCRVVLIEQSTSEVNISRLKKRTYTDCCSPVWCCPERTAKELAIRCRWCWCFRCASPVCVCVSVACASARCVPHFKNRISLSFSPSEKIFALPFLLFSVSFFYSCHLTTCPLTFHPFSLEFTQSGEML